MKTRYLMKIVNSSAYFMSLLLFFFYNCISVESLPVNSKTFRGKLISTDLLNKIKQFNANMNNLVPPNANYNQVRQEMNRFGLPGSKVHVGHIYPNQKGTSRYNGPEDRAINLMAHPSSDNIALGHRPVLEKELKYYKRISRC